MDPNQQAQPQQNITTQNPVLQTPQANPNQETIGTKFKDGWSFFKASLTFLFKKPIFILPLLIEWIIVSGIVLFLRYFWVFPKNSFALAEIFLFIFLISYAIILGNLMLLELIKQVEDNTIVSFPKAFRRVISFDAIKVLPLAIFFAVVWFIILLIKVLTSKKRNNQPRPQPSLEDAAKTLGGIGNNPFSWLGLGLDLFEKLLRMTIFLALPAIAWENKGSSSGFKRAVEIIKTHPVQFLTTYALTGVTSLIMALPLLPVYIASNANIHLSNEVWLFVLVYEGIAWSLGIYLEQMTDALLYLWHLKWLQGGGTGDLSSFMKPNLLDDFHNLESPAV